MRTQRTVGGRALVSVRILIICCVCRKRAMGLTNGELPAAFCPCVAPRLHQCPASCPFPLASSSASATLVPFSLLPTTNQASASTIRNHLSSEEAKILLVNTFRGFFQINFYLPNTWQSQPAFFSRNLGTSTETPPVRLLKAPPCVAFFGSLVISTRDL